MRGSRPAQSESRQSRREPFVGGLSEGDSELHDKIAVGDASYSPCLGVFYKADAITNNNPLGPSTHATEAGLSTAQMLTTM
jgi:hypothetical protein